MIKNFKKVFMTMLVILMLIMSVGNSVKAVINSVIDTTKTASLTITKYENSNGGTENKELAGVEFTIYLVPSDIDDVTTAITYTEQNSVTSYTKTTPGNGTIQFSDLELGRYLVVETNAPKNVVTKIESFLVDLPRTNDDGDGWNYDVTVYPKNETIYGSVTLNQVTEENNALEGTCWILQKLNSNSEWEKYDYDGNLTTDENGKILIENLEVGDYRLIQSSTIEGYILDVSDTMEFSITTQNINYEFTSTNEKLYIQKYILLDDGSYGEDVGAFKTDTNSWKIEATVADIINKMDEYVVTDELPNGLTYDLDSIRIYGENSNGEITELASGNYAKALSETSLKVNFDTEKLSGFTNVIITYDTNFGSDVTYGNFVNQAKLTYTNCITEQGKSDGNYTTSDDASVHTGSVLIHKIDQYGNSLSGAVFKIATSEDNAKEGIFVKDENNNDLTATSDENGYVVFNGLKYDGTTDYWIVEVEAPSYEDNGEIKYYNLLSKSVDVKVNSTSQIYDEDTTTKVVNKKGFVLPLTGSTISIISIILGLCVISVVLITRKRKTVEKDIK